MVRGRAQPAPPLGHLVAQNRVDIPDPVQAVGVVVAHGVVRHIALDVRQVRGLGAQVAGALGKFPSRGGQQRRAVLVSRFHHLPSLGHRGGKGTIDKGRNTRFQKGPRQQGVERNRVDVVDIDSVDLADHVPGVGDHADLWVLFRKTLAHPCVEAPSAGHHHARRAEGAGRRIHLFAPNIVRVAAGAGDHSYAEQVAGRGALKALLGHDSSGGMRVCVRRA